MPIGVVSNEDFNLEIQRGEASPVPSSQIKNLHNGGRDKGDNNVPESLRKIIGETAAIEGRGVAKEIAKQFGVSDSSVSAYTKGATSTKSYKQKNSELLEFINAGKLKLANRARSRLASTLREITDAKLENADLKDLANVAKAMSGVIKDMTPTLPTESTGANVFNGPSIVMYNPGFSKEESFDTIDLTNETE